MEEFKLPKLLTREQVLAKDRHGLTVGDLRKFIEKHNLPDDAPVLIERVEDVYYETNNWSVYLKGGMLYHSALETNAKMAAEIERRARGEEPHFSAENPADYIADESLLDQIKTQYTPAWSCVNYRDDNGILFIDLHY